MTLLKLELARTLEDIRTKLLKTSREIVDVTIEGNFTNEIKEARKNHLTLLIQEKDRLEKASEVYSKSLNQP
jgi:hypothetical protein